MKLPPLDTSPENLAYIRALQPGEEVIECGESCMKGCKGVVYLSKDGGGTCVRWDTSKRNMTPKAAWMGTSVTWGTRRIADLAAQTE